MRFKFWAVIKGTEVSLQATGLYEARTEAKNRGATSARGLNPGTKKFFPLVLH